MELSNEKYDQIFRYVNEEMNEAERSAFESDLKKSEELSDEVELYKEIRSLSTSVNHKLGTPAFSFYEEEKQEKEDGSIMIKKSRQNWENEHEAALKQKYGISATETNSVPIKKQGKERKLGLWMKLAVAAAILVVISLSTWYLLSTKDETRVANNDKGMNVPAKVHKQADTSKNIAAPSTSTQNNELPSVAISKQEKNKTHRQKKDEINAPGTNPANDVKDEALFADNFKPDMAPPDKEGALQDALAYYENKRYRDAIEAFENADFGPVTRNEKDESLELLRFYGHYYKGLSYLAVGDSAIKAINELKIAKTTDKYLLIKAQWYLALAYLKAGYQKNAEVILKKMSSSNNSAEYKHKAIQLLKQLKGGK